MWQSNVSDFPQRVFKASSLRNLFKLLIKRSFINWHMYMRSIYWQAMPKVKKKSHKQRQRLDKIRKRDERDKWWERGTTTSKTDVEKSSKPSVDVHVANNNLVVLAATYVFVVWNFTRLITMLRVGGWMEGGGTAYLDFVGGAFSSNLFTIWCRIRIYRPPRAFRRFKRRSCYYVSIEVSYITSYDMKLLTLVCHSKAMPSTSHAYFCGGHFL